MGQAQRAVAELVQKQGVLVQAGLQKVLALCCNAPPMMTLCFHHIHPAGESVKQL